MEGLTSPAKELSTGSGSTIHPTAWKKNSRKFTVAISPALFHTPVPIWCGEHDLAR
jgi:hypothetical protein